MAGKVYHSEEEYRTAVLRRNETKKMLAGIASNLGAGLIAAAAVQSYADGRIAPATGGWFLAAGLLIYAGAFFLKSLDAER
ncbi:hypothetical protein D3M59_04695 [Sphingomonas edaphi]|uniref:Uncharacterized protein n=1 Tax=Sphingomonas edaphi TaxID=2315689 RepID=A0A418Q327_9SPHN|nr:hypothetical protein D3M59_04695 [Sphingomonas edaphi]